MSSTSISSFHSSSDCPTAHISRRNVENDDLNSNFYSATSMHPKASGTSNATGMTPLDSDALASPMARQSTSVSASFTPSPTTVHWAEQRLDGTRPPGVSIASPSSPSHLSNSPAASSVDAPLPLPQRAPMLSSSLDNNKNSNHHHRHGLHNFPHVVSSPAQEAAAEARRLATGTPAGTPQAATNQPKPTTLTIEASILPTSTASSAETTSKGTTTATPSRRTASSPLVPTTRGTARCWMRSPSQEDEGAKTSTATASDGILVRKLSRLPPLRPPSSYFIAGSKSGSSHASRRNGSSLGATPTSQVGDGGGRGLMAPHSTAQVRLLPQTLATSEVTDPVNENKAEDKSWWTAARRYAASKSEQVNAYLERLVNPGAVDFATANARTAAAQACSRRASQVFQMLPGSARNRTTSSLSNNNRNDRHSRTASISSGFDGIFDAEPRTLPLRQPTTRGHRDRSPFEPFHGVSRQDTDDGNGAMPLDVVMIDPVQEPYVWNGPLVEAPEVWVEQRNAANDSFNIGDVSESDENGMDGEPHTYVVDLLSALRGYLSNPTEPFGHLVAAALASRSAETPVHGFEVAAAEHNPFLVRMIVDSGALEVHDEEAQRNVQDTVDELIPTTEGELSPGIYEYLSSFFKMPFVRLSHEQYALLKRSGFEYIKLMFDHQHVLPDEPFHSILVNESHVMHVINIVFMIVQLLSIIFCTVTIALVLASWMKMNNNALQSYGFYTLIVFGGGWALYLIFIIYAVRGRQDEQRYEPQENNSDHLLVPSPYVAVVPIIPLFDIFCLVKYVVTVRKKYMILGHNIVASSRLSGAFYAVWFAFPQLITQSYFNNVELEIEAKYRHRWAYIMLIVGVICQWGTALVGYLGFLFTHDSIDGFGFACFNMGRVPHMLERHNAAAHALHYLTAFLLETNVYVVASTTINRPAALECDTYWNVMLALSAFSIFYILIIFFVITLTDATAVRISFTCVVLLAVQVALCACSERLQRAECATCRRRLFRGTFVFGYLSWGAYFLMFIVWLVMMLQWCILCRHMLNLFPRVLWPYARRDKRFAKAKRVEEASPDKGTSSRANGNSNDGAQTL